MSGGGIMAELDRSWFVNVKDKDLRREGIIIAEGRLVAERTAAHCPGLGILCVPAAAQDAEKISGGTIPVKVLPEADIGTLVGYPFHRGLLLAARRPELQPLMDAGILLRTGRRLVVLPHITDPENMGTIIRTAAALGWDGVLIGGSSCDPYSRRVLRCSMAAVFALPVFSFDSAADLELLGQHGWELWAAMLAAEAKTPDALQSVTKLGLILGNERFGLAKDLQGLCTGKVAIPQIRLEADGVDSLNVAAAAAILLWEGLAH